MKKQKGFILIVFMIVGVAMLVAGAAVLRVAYFSSDSAYLELCHFQALYLAESAAQIGEREIVNNPSFATDLAHNPLDDQDWIYFTSSGYNTQFGTGTCKVVRESGRNSLYAVGYLGNNIEQAKARAIIKIEFTLPFSVESWSLL